MTIYKNQPCQTCHASQTSKTKCLSRWQLQKPGCRPPLDGWRIWCMMAGGNRGRDASNESGRKVHTSAQLRRSGSKLPVQEDRRTTINQRMRVRLAQNHNKQLALIQYKATLHKELYAYICAQCHGTARTPSGN